MQLWLALAPAQFNLRSFWMQIQNELPNIKVYTKFYAVWADFDTPKAYVREAIAPLQIYFPYSSSSVS